MAVAIGNIATGAGSGAYKCTVRSAEDAVASSLPKVGTFETAGYPLSRDGLHYTSAGYVTLGTDAVSTWRRLGAF
jgi:hypothetical protein